MQLPAASDGVNIKFDPSLSLPTLPFDTSGISDYGCFACGQTAFRSA